MSAGRRLLTGPAGSGKTTVALGRIRDAATERGLRGRHVRDQGQALLVLPTYAQVRHTQRIALTHWGARAMIDAPFATFTSAGERFLHRFRVRALPTAVERDRLMAAALDVVAPTVFTRSGDAPGLRARLVHLIKDLKQTGRTGAALRARMGATLEQLAPNAQDRARDFVRVFAAYEHLLTDAGFEDHEDVLRRLAESLETADPTRVPAVLVFDGFDDFTVIEHRILDALVAHVTGVGGDVLVTLPFDERRPDLFAGSAPTRVRLLASGFVEEQLEVLPRFADPALAHLSQHLFGTPQMFGDTPSSDETHWFGEIQPTNAPEASAAVRVIVAGDPEDEAECVARAVRALERHVPGPKGFAPGWRNVGIVCRDLTREAPRLRAALARLGVPARTLHTGPALTHVAWMGALQAPLRVLAGETEAGRFMARPLRAWLRWCAAARDDAAARTALDAWDIRHRLRGDPSTWAEFQSGLPEALVSDGERLEAARLALDEARGAIACFEQLTRWIDELVPLPRGGGLRPDGTVLDVGRDDRRREAAAAARRVQTMLEGLAATARRTHEGDALRAHDAIQALEESWLDATLPMSDRRLDAVNLLDPHTARYWELDHVFVVGLAEGAFPVRPREDVLLRDADRDTLASGDPALTLPKAQDREVREQRLFYGSVTRARHGLWLSRPAYDRNGNPLQPSVYWDLVHGFVTPTCEHTSSGPGRLAWPERWTFTTGDLLRLAALRRHDDPEFSRAVLDEAPHLPARARAHVRRAPAALHTPDVMRRFAESVAHVHVSALNQARVCPYRHFARRILGIRSDELSFDGRPFDYREEGKVLHDAFHLAVLHPDREAGDIATACAATVDVGPAQRSLLTHELTRAVELLRERERNTAGPFTPTTNGLEHAFGEDEDVWLGAGEERFRLRGRVDRVDRRGDRLVLVDYKRSKTSTQRSQKEALEFQDLQLPLYARALEVSWGERVVGLEWIAQLLRDRRAIWSAGAARDLAVRKEGVAPLVESDEAFRKRLESAEATAAHTVAAIRDGDSARRPLSDQACDHCSWRDICRPDRTWLRAERER